jgi:hypothetical protein
MLNPGVSHPRRTMLVCLGVTGLAWASIAWGAAEMHLAGRETLGSGLKIGLAVLPAILGPFMALNFRRGMKVVAAIRRGENEIARWSVTAAELAAFSAQDRALNLRGGETLNVWTPPRQPPHPGIEVIFVTDGVLVGDTYYALVTTGAFTASDPRLLPGAPPAIAFRTATSSASRFGGRPSIGALRIPVPHAAAAVAARVLDHFTRVESRAIFVNPDFYRSRMRAGLIGAPFFLAAALVGVAMKWSGRPDPDDIAGLLIGIGILCGGGLLILALAAWMLSAAQHRKPRAG